MAFSVLRSKFENKGLVHGRTAFAQTFELVVFIIQAAERQNGLEQEGFAVVQAALLLHGLEEKPFTQKGLAKFCITQRVFKKIPRVPVQNFAAAVLDVQQADVGGRTARRMR